MDCIHGHCLEVYGSVMTYICGVGVFKLLLRLIDSIRLTSIANIVTCFRKELQRVWGLWTASAAWLCQHSFMTGDIDMEQWDVHSPEEGREWKERGLRRISICFSKVWGNCVLRVQGERLNGGERGEGCCRKTPSQRDLSLIRHYPELHPPYTPLPLHSLPKQDFQAAWGLNTHNEVGGGGCNGGERRGWVGGGTLPWKITWQALSFWMAAEGRQGRREEEKANHSEQLKKREQGGGRGDGGGPYMTCVSVRSICWNVCVAPASTFRLTETLQRRETAPALRLRREQC